MAHYAFLDENNIVTEVITGKDETELLDGLTPEEWYGNYRGQKCVRTSYNAKITTLEPIADGFIIESSYFGIIGTNTLGY